MSDSDSNAPLGQSQSFDTVHTSRAPPTADAAAPAPTSVVPQPVAMPPAMDLSTQIAAQQQAYLAYKEQKLSLKRMQAERKAERKAAAKMQKRQQKAWARQQAAAYYGYAPRSAPSPYAPPSSARAAPSPYAMSPHVDQYHLYQHAKAEHKKNKISRKHQAKLMKAQQKSHKKAAKQQMKTMSYMPYGAGMRWGHHPY